MKPDKKSNAVIRIGMEKIEYSHRKESEKKEKMAPFPGGFVFPIYDICDNNRDDATVRFKQRVHGGIDPGDIMTAENLAPY